MSAHQPSPHEAGRADPTAPPGPAARGRGRATRVGGAAALVGVLTVGAAVLWWSQAGEETSGSPASPSPQFTGPAIEAPSPPSPSATPDAPHYGAIIVTTAVDELSVYAEAGGGERVASLDRWSEAAFAPLTLRGITTAEVDGAEWIQVSLPVRPNGQTGWVRSGDVSVSSTDTAIHVFLDEHLLQVREGAEVVWETPVAVGADETPTPLGVFYVTDPLDFSHNDTGVYGAYALGLSGFSEVLDTFDGGPPQVAIHGTNQPDLIGQSVSNGCLRMSNDDILALAELADLGTPVVIHAALDDAPPT